VTAEPQPSILQLDFDGTVVHGDASWGIMSHFIGDAMAPRFTEASRQLKLDAGSTALVDVMKLGCSLLTAPLDECVAYAFEMHPVRPGLARLVSTARGLGMSVEINSYGFDFYISQYLRNAGVLDDVTLRCGMTRPSEGGLILSYTGPNGEDVTSLWKETWSQHYQRLGLRTVYVGDGRSDLPSAQLAAAVFARDELLASMPASYAGVVRPFDTLDDVADGLLALYGEAALTDK
jgi:2-hydroxy-3-keto-5-methylthiopentenyl-1-phosphate phosphatase